MPGFIQRCMRRALIPNLNMNFIIATVQDGDEIEYPVTSDTVKLKVKVSLENGTLCDGCFGNDGVV